MSESERTLWQERYERLARFGAPSSDDDAALMAWVAERFEAPSVADLQVRRHEASHDEEHEAPELLVPRLDGEVQWQIEAVPLRVRFDAGYADASSLLRRLGAQLSPIRIERLEMRRRYPQGPGRARRHALDPPGGDVMKRSTLGVVLAASAIAVGFQNYVFFSSLDGGRSVLPEAFDDEFEDEDAFEEPLPTLDRVELATWIESLPPGRSPSSRSPSPRRWAAP